MKTEAKSMAPTGATVVTVRTASDVVARGGPGVRTARAGAWDLIADDLGLDCPGCRRRLDRVVDDVDTDPIEAVVEHFRTSREMFALSGPPGVIAGSGPLFGARVAIWVEPGEGLVALGLAPDTRGPGWLTLPAGTAVAWGPEGPEVFIDLRPPAVRLWVADDRTGAWVPAEVAAPAA